MEKAVMVNIHELPKQVQIVRWSPHRENSLLAVAEKSAKLFLIDTLTGASEVIDYSKVVTKSQKISTVIWHPRMQDHCLVGFSEGMIALSNLAAQARVKTWIVSDQAKAEISRTPGVREIVYSPGEEVFLAVRSDGNVFLFSMQD